jgi:hypothetical protein
MSTKTLSKSRYLSGCQCPLKLWYDCYRKELAAEITEEQQAIFDAGHMVGRLACKRMPGGVLIEHDYIRPERALHLTEQLLADPTVPAIFEAAFLHNNVLIRTDILERKENNTWVLHEVKSSTHVKSVYEADVAVQHHVLRSTGLVLQASGLVTLNRGYVYDGAVLDYDLLFKFHDLTDISLDLEEKVATNIAQFNALISTDTEPVVEPGDHCFAPYECRYLAHCTRDYITTDYPVTELPRISKSKLSDLEQMEITDISDIPEDFPLTDNQRRVWQAVVSNREYVSENLANELAAIEYPIYYLDFEACNPAIPRYKGTRPFDAVPFQFSVHIEEEDGGIEHVEFLHTENSDPRENLAAALISTLGDKGTICVYSGYEKRTINDLIAHLPTCADRLQALIGRLWDLNRIISYHYYHPGFHGSLSIKKVLPVLVPELSYKKLDIQEGGAAARLYLVALDSDDAAFKNEIFTALKEYCGLDTFAMLKLNASLSDRANRK